MYFSCSKDQLLSGVSIVQKAVSSKISLEVLKGIKIEVVDGVLTFSATDLELGIQTSQTLIDSENGAIVVPAKLFADIVKKLPNSWTISCTQKGNVLKIAYKDSVIEITTMDPEEFPLMPDVDVEPIEIDSTTFKNALSKVRVAISKETARPVFTGVLFNLKYGALDLVGTDTHRLALLQMEVETKEELMAIIPGNAVDELLRLPDNIKLGIKFDGGQFIFETENTKIYTRTIDGQFPNYRQVIPKDWLSRIKVSPRELMGVIDRASILADNNIVTMIDGLKIETKDVKGSISERYDIETEGEPIKVSFNSGFMIDALKTFSSNEVEMWFNGAFNAIAILEEGYTHIVLPVRTQG